VKCGLLNIQFGLDPPTISGRMIVHQRRMEICPTDATRREFGAARSCPTMHAPPAFHVVRLKWGGGRSKAGALASDRWNRTPL